MLAVRFRGLVIVGAPDECWIWPRPPRPTGYAVLSGRVAGRRRLILVHRLAWVLHNQLSLTDELTVDHLCRVRVCVNPAHLEAVTLSENVRRRGPSRPALFTPEERRHRTLAALRELRRCDQCGAEVQSRNLSRHRDRFH